ncbi:MAG: CDP-alcohol phosphatidyltransferase family protein [Eubacteriales bacterium]
MKAKNIPNILSFIRLLMVPVFIYVFFKDYPDNIYPALFVFLLAGATDILDGYLARRNGWITNLGKLLDPFADKLMQLSALVCLYIKQIVPLWIVGLFALKESVMVFGALLVLKKTKVTVMANGFGKAATTVFYAMIVALIILHGTLSSDIIAIMCLVTFAITAVAMIIYIKGSLDIRARTKLAKNEGLNAD